MKKKTIITTETREIWVIHQPSIPLDPQSPNTNESASEAGLPSTPDFLKDSPINPFENPTIADEQE